MYMYKRPKEWEVICKVCMAGLVMSDEEVAYRLGKRKEGLWPNHCGQVMLLRHKIIEVPREDCCHTGCWAATKASCSCPCGGKNHGVMNPNPNYTEIKIKEPEWYRKPIGQFLKKETLLATL